MLASKLIRQDRACEHIARLSDSELLEWGEGILRNLSRWILEGREGEVAERYEGLGKLRFQEAVPLHEAVRGLHVLKDVMVEVYPLVHGYEAALRKAAHMAA